MSIQEVTAETLAELFHHYHEALAPDFRCRNGSPAMAWSQLPAEEKNRAIAAARLTLLEIAATRKESQDSRRYFAKPGEAEWGC